MLGKKFYKNNYRDEEYFECSTWCGLNNAVMVDKGDYFECVPESKMEKSDNDKAVERINELKELLFNTDYQAIKFAEGVMSAEEYAPIKEQREEWRLEINMLEEELNLNK